MSRLTAIFEDPESTPPILYLALAEKYGPNVLDGEYAAIKAELEEELGHEVNESIMNKVMAAISVMTNDYWQNRIIDFSRVTIALATGAFDLLNYRPPSVYEIAIASVDICLLRTGYPLIFADRIKRFVNLSCSAEQYVLVPKIINYLYDVDNNFRAINAWQGDKPMMDAVYAIAKTKVDKVDMDVIEQFQRFIDCAYRHGYEASAKYATAMLTAYSESKSAFFSFKSAVEAEK